MNIVKYRAILSFTNSIELGDIMISFIYYTTSRDIYYIYYLKQPKSNIRHEDFRAYVCVCVCHAQGTPPGF